MKKLIFVRHGKAEDQSPEFSDFERSLTQRGKYISKMMARKFMEKDNSHGIFISSPAFRALETAFIFAAVFGIEPEKVIISSGIYFNLNFSNLHEILSLVNEDIDKITLFGHNPSFSEISNMLCKEGCDSIPKSGLVGIAFNIKTWSDVQYNTGKMEYFLKPERTE